MGIERFEDIDLTAVWRIKTWQPARELTSRVYGPTKKAKFACNFDLKGQIQDATGSYKRFRVQGFSNL